MSRCRSAGDLPGKHTESERKSVCSFESIIELLASVADDKKCKGCVKEEEEKKEEEEEETSE